MFTLLFHGSNFHGLPVNHENSENQNFKKIPAISVADLGLAKGGFY